MAGIGKMGEIKITPEIKKLLDNDVYIFKRGRARMVEESKEGFILIPVSRLTAYIGPQLLNLPELRDEER